MKKQYNTEQRRAVTEFFKNNPDRHFSVQEISEALSREGAGKSTVYRHISKLHEAGVLRRFEVNGCRSFVYQYSDLHDDCNSHYHLKCNKCGRLIHMECPHLNDVRDHVKNEHDFIIGFGRAIIYGECTLCAQKEI